MILRGFGSRAARKAVRRAGDLLVALGDRLPEPRGVEGLPAWQRAALSYNATLRGRHAGRRCLVVGDGPSIRTLSSHALSSVIVFLASPDICLPITAGDIYGWGRKDGVKDRCSHERFNVIVPFLGDGHLATHQLMIDPDLPREALGNVDLTQPIPGLWTTLELSILVAMYMGCNPIYLVGFEHDWLACLDRPPPRGSRKSAWRYLQRIQFVIRLWTGYERLITIATRRDVRIVNATPKSHLDLFDLISLDEALAP